MGIADDVRNTLKRVESTYTRIKNLKVPSASAIARKVGSDVTGAVKSGVSEATEFIRQMIEQILVIMGNVLGEVREMRGTLSDMLSSVISSLNGFWIRTQEFITEKFEDIKTFMTETFATIGSAATGIFDTIKKYFFTIVAAILGIIGIYVLI